KGDGGDVVAGLLKEEEERNQIFREKMSTQSFVSWPWSLWNSQYRVRSLRWAGVNICDGGRRTDFPSDIACLPLIWGGQTMRSLKNLLRRSPLMKGPVIIPSERSIMCKGVSNLVDKAGPSDIPPNLGVFELTNGGIIGGNCVVSDLPLKKSWTSTFENDYTCQVKAKHGAEMITEIQPSYALDSSGQQYPLVGSETNYGNMGQAYGAMSQTQDYTAYLNNMSGLNYGNPLSNEGSAEPLAVYQKMVENLTSSLHQTEGMLDMALAMNRSTQNAVNGLSSKNESLKSHYSMSCASYSSIFGDLNRAKGLEANLSRKVSALEREKLALRHDLDWVMKKSISKMLARVFRIEQFDRELVKVHKVFGERGRELGRQEARDLLMTDQRLPGCDPNLPHKVNDVVRGLKRVKWECMETIVSSSDLSPNFLRSVLERGDSGAGEGSSSRLVT
nr:hypothetical protein [Tanacetum cinerariifolium]